MSNQSNPFSKALAAVLLGSIFTGGAIGFHAWRDREPAPVVQPAPPQQAAYETAD